MTPSPRTGDAWLDSVLPRVESPLDGRDGHENLTSLAQSIIASTATTTPAPPQRPTRPRRRHRSGVRDLFPRALLVAAAAVLALVVGVTAIEHWPGFGFLTPASPGAASRVVIVVSGTANEPRAALTSDARAVLASAAEHAGASVTVASADGETFVQLPLSPQRPAGSVYRNETEIERNLNQVASTVESLASTEPGLDLLEALSSATRGNAPGTLIVVSNGLSTDGAFDVRRTGWSADPQDLVEHLRAVDALPDLAGWDVIWSGLGATAGDQPPLPAALRATLASYWSAILQGSGAATVEVASPSAEFSPSVALVAMPVVSVPEVTSVVGPAETRTVVPSALLGFFPDSDVLRPEGRVLIVDLADRLNADLADRPDAVITITGFTADPPGRTPAQLQELSHARARAVADVLVSLGVSNPIVVSGGGAAPGMTAIVEGRFDGAVADQMRRVEISY